MKIPFVTTRVIDRAERWLESSHDQRRNGTASYLSACVVSLGLIIAIPSIAEEKREPAGGEIAGAWRPVGSKPVPTSFRFQSERVGKGKAKVRLGVDGEQFVGEYARLGPKQPDVILRRFYLGWTSTVYDSRVLTPLGGPWVREEWSFDLFQNRYGGDVIAILVGNRGGHMRCRFELDDPEAGLIGGARGACQSNSGERIFFPASAGRD